MELHAGHSFAQNHRYLQSDSHSETAVWPDQMSELQSKHSSLFFLTVHFPKLFIKEIIDHCCKKYNKDKTT